AQASLHRAERDLPVLVPNRTEREALIENTQKLGELSRDDRNATLSRLSAIERQSSELGVIRNAVRGPDSDLAKEEMKRALTIVDGPAAGEAEARDLVLAASGKQTARS